MRREIGASPYPKYEPLSGAIPRTRAARQFVNSFNSLLRRLRPTNELRRSPQPRCKNSINSNLRRERPERAASSEPRATPWVSMHKRLRPVRAKVWANGWLLLLPLQGAGAVRTLAQGVALGYELAGLSARAGPLTIGLWTCWAIARPGPLVIGMWTYWGLFRAGKKNGWAPRGVQPLILECIRNYFTITFLPFTM